MKKVLISVTASVLALVMLCLSTSIVEVPGMSDAAGSSDELYARFESVIAKEGKNIFMFNDMSREEILETFNAILLNHPEFMTLDRKFTLLSLGPFKRITFAYNKVDTPAALAAVKVLAGSIEGTDEEKIEALYRYLTTNVTYRNHEFVDSTVYGALVNGMASCEGYSESMSMVLTEWGIENYLVSGEVNGEPHRWVRVKVRNTWWDFDPTFDAGSKLWKYYMVEKAH